MSMSQPQSESRAGPPGQSATKAPRDAGVPQSVGEHKKPSFAEGGDLRLQVAEALVFIREITPDMCVADLFYIDQAIDILNRLVDADHIDRAGVQEVLAWDF